MEVTDETITSLNLTVASLSCTNVYEGENYTSEEAIGLNAIQIDMKPVLISASFNGRRIGIMGPKADICECHAGSVYNFGIDGSVAEVVGDNAWSFSIGSKIIGDGYFTVNADVLN